MAQLPECDFLYTNVFVALGANVAPFGQTLVQAAAQAVALLEAPEFRVMAQSRLFHTPCFPAGAGPDYVNGVLKIHTTLSAKEVLSRLHDVESALGRERVQRWGSRTMDLDLIAYGDVVLPDLATFAAWRDLPPPAQIRRTPDQLILPHPRLADRAFVLIPLLDIAPDWVHPVSRLTVREMAEALPEADKQAVIPLS